MSVTTRTRSNLPKKHSSECIKIEAGLTSKANFPPGCWRSPQICADTMPDGARGIRQSPWMKLRARMKLMTGIFLSPLKRHRQVWQSGRNLLNWSEMRLIGFLTISKQLSYYLSTKTFLMMRSAGSWDVRQRR